MSVIKDITTNKDGESFCPVRIIMLASTLLLSLTGLISFIIDEYIYVYSIFNVISVEPAAPRFDMIGYGAAIAAIMSGGGAGIYAKRTTEPDGGSNADCK